MRKPSKLPDREQTKKQIKRKLGNSIRGYEGERSHLITKEIVSEISRNVGYKNLQIDIWKYQKTRYKEMVQRLPGRQKRKGKRLKEMTALMSVEAREQQRKLEGKETSFSR